MRSLIILVLALVLMLAACGGVAPDPAAPGLTRVPATAPIATVAATDAAETPTEAAAITNTPPVQTAMPAVAPTAVAPQPTPTGTPEPIPACAAPLELTAANTEGPYYSPGAPTRASLLEPGMPGTRLILTGRVLTPNCRPIPGAVLDFWQANAAGEYDNVGYTLRGKQSADAEGHYRLETVLPGEYPGRTPHIHVKVGAPGGPALTTQIYFAGQPGNETDSIILPSLITELRSDQAGGLTAEFNFVLAE